MTIDSLGKPCEHCPDGTYEETCLYDDWDGTLHCTVCNNKVKRRVEAEPLKPE